MRAVLCEVGEMWNQSYRAVDFPVSLPASAGSLTGNLPVTFNFVNVSLLLIKKIYLFTNYASVVFYYLTAVLFTRLESFYAQRKRLCWFLVFFRNTDAVIWWPEEEPFWLTCCCSKEAQLTRRNLLKELWVSRVFFFLLFVEYVWEHEQNQE